MQETPLYFTGKVSSTVSLNSDTALQVNSISNPDSIKDMCNLSGTSQTFSDGNTNIKVDATKPVLTVRDEGYCTARLWLADHHKRYAAHREQRNRRADTDLVSACARHGSIGSIDTSVSGFYLYESCDHGCVGEG